MIPFAYYIFIGTIFLAAGIALQHFYDNIPFFCAPVLFIFLELVIVLWICGDNRYRIALLCTYCIGALAGGASMYSYQWHRFEQFHAAVPKQPCIVHGIIGALEPVEHLRTPYRITIDITQIQHEQNETVIPLHGSIFVYAHHTPLVRVGDIVTIPHCTIKKPTDIDFTQYLVKEGIYATIFLDHFVVQKCITPRWSLARIIAEQKNSLFSRMRNKITPSAFALYSALFLGNRSFDKKETKQLNTQFKHWGISHVYARSGMHLGLIVFVWFVIMRCIPLPYRIKHILIALLIIVYAILSWPSISFSRSFGVFLLYQWCRFMKEPYNLLYLTVLVCGLTLLINPLQLFFLDFQLSYALTIALAFLYQMRSHANST